MKRKKKQQLTKKATLLVLSLAAATSLYASLASAADNAASDQGSALHQARKPAADIQLIFDGVQVVLPKAPQLIGNTMMVTGPSLLDGFGYQLKWDSEREQLTATHSSRPSLVFQAGRKAAEVDGQTGHALIEAPFMDEDGLLWIPLRFAAETSGMKVSWQTEDRMAVVKEPNPLLQLRISTRADQAVTGNPGKLMDYIRAEQKAEIQLTLIPPLYYRDKTNLMIAAGDPTDLMLIEQPFQYNEELFTSFATDLTGMLEQFPRLQALAAESSPSARSIDGRLYGIPRPYSPHQSAFPAIRKDWLDKLGLKAPETMDELYNVLVRFVKDDPDADGKHNTIGITAFTKGQGLGSLSWVEQAFTGSPERFMLKDGQVIDTAVGSEELQALNWISKAYADGLIDKEFAISQENHALDKIQQGRVGLAAMSLEQAAEASTLSDHAAGGSAPLWVPLAKLQAGSNSPIAPWNSEGSGLYIIPRTVPTDKAVKLLEWLDQGLAMSEAGAWEQIDGLNEQDRVMLANLFGQSTPLDGSTAINKLSSAAKSGYQSAVKQWSSVDYSRSSVPQAALQQVYRDYSETIGKVEELKIKYILGKLSPADWENHMKAMTSSQDYKSMMETLNLIVKNENPNI
ncbi:extracellular solute-binding protein [Paenibacillus sp. y28]|uniref:extracellular solute-binding protein n=1 Tax=Paenibacillus sp. y28 TaxID=3129110 RepID=UPI0030198B3B